MNNEKEPNEKKKSIILKYESFVDRFTQKRVEKRIGKNQKDEQDNDVIEDDKIDEVKHNKKESFWLIFSILSAILYSIFVFSTLDFSSSKVINIIILGMIVVYVIVLILLVVFSQDEKKLKLRIKNYKGAVKVLKNATSIIGLVLSISVLVKSTYFSFNNLFNILYMLLMIGISILSILITVVQIVFRGKIEKQKAIIKQKIKENIQEMRK